MKLAKILALSFFLTSGIKASVAVETALPLPTAVPMEASIAAAGTSQTNSTMHTIALICGLLAFAAAAQQAIFARGAVMQRIKIRKD